MCWNQAVSLNTFLFSIFILCLIIYNNNYTQYKVKSVGNIWMYLFFASFIFMQLFEFFIWRNIDNKFYNHVFSVMAAFLIVIQPVASLMTLTNIPLRNVLLTAYLIVSIPYFIYKFNTENMKTVVSEKGHLKWLFFNQAPSIFIVWLFFFLFSLVYERKWSGFLFGFLSLCIFYYNYANDNTMGSMWCWVVNSVMIYYAAYLLLYLPFCDKKGLC